MAGAAPGRRRRASGRRAGRQRRGPQARPDRDGLAYGRARKADRHSPFRRAHPAGASGREGRRERHRAPERRCRTAAHRDRAAAAACAAGLRHRQCLRPWPFRDMRGGLRAERDRCGLQRRGGFRPDRCGCEPRRVRRRAGGPAGPSGRHDVGDLRLRRRHRHRHQFRRFDRPAHARRRGAGFRRQGRLSRARLAAGGRRPRPAGPGCRAGCRQG